MPEPSSLFARMSAIADPLRSRMLLVLEKHELTVGELCAVFQLPQSSTSRLLKSLADEGWLAVRAEGTTRRYRLPLEALDPAARRLWALVREQAAQLDATERDARRVGSVLAERRSASQEFFATAAGQWDRVRAELFGRAAGEGALLALLEESWTVGDLGCGTGQVSAWIAPFVRRVVAVDESAAMLAAARRRFEAGAFPNVELRPGELESLPLEDAELDAAVLFLVLHYLGDPAAALREVARVLKPGGRVLVVDMVPHERDDYRQRMGHVWQGFSAERLGEWCAAAGLSSFRYVPLAPDPEAKGPGLFAGSAKKVIGYRLSVVGTDNR